MPTVIASRMETYFFISFTSSYPSIQENETTILPTPGIYDFQPFAPDFSESHYK